MRKTDSERWFEMRAMIRAKHWCCGECATKAGGRWTPDLSSPIRRATCPICKKRDVVLIPAENFNFMEGSAS